MIWHLIRYWITFFIPVFYKKIGIKNANRLNVKGPVIIAMNHPNAFTDPIVISYLAFPTKLKYLARGDAFKPGLISTFLEILGIVPIFRIQDGGIEGLKKNTETYRRVNHLLKKNAKLIIFAEGLCVQERRLRPLKKGVARMAFGAYESIQNENLIVLPVGVNYDCPHKFRSKVFYNVGEPILVKDYIEDYKNNPAKTTLQFLTVLESKMKALITNINKKENDEVVIMIETLCKKDWIVNYKLNANNLEDDFLVTQKITDLVNKTSETNQNELDNFKELGSKYFNKIKKHGLSDHNVHNFKSFNFFRLFFNTICLLLLFPLYLISLIGNFLPLYLTDLLTRKVIKRVEFYSSVALAFGMVIFLINYIFIFLIAHSFSFNAIFCFAICALLIVAGWFGLFYYPFLKKTIEMYRLRINKSLANELNEDRDRLITLINNF